MKITAQQISQWAATREAQSALPRLVRSLVHYVATTTSIAMPAGASVSAPGWDGVVVSTNSSAWVPQGTTYWELSCEDSVTSKANKDFSKRTKATSDELRKNACFVFVSALRWSTKDKWLSEKRNENSWGDIRAFDADDLEQWLEQTPAVALDFAEELGLAGPGVESVRRVWNRWSLQSQPVISAEAIVAGRERVREKLQQQIVQGIAGAPTPIALRADSILEATAFASEILLSDEHLRTKSVVVTSQDGWRFVEKNLNIAIVVAGNPEIAELAIQRSGLVVIVPLPIGDLSGRYGGDDVSDTRLERPGLQEFEKALVDLGLGRSDAERLAQTSGRSWSVVRRRLSTNPAIRNPIWQQHADAWVLSTLCLVSSWQSEKDSDKDIVATIAGKSYDDIERALVSLASLDDAPVLKIGSVWKAKSSLELMDQCGFRIARSELGRFFEVVRETLSEPDPTLELPSDKRYAAGIYGKEFPTSGLLRRSLADGLTKLATRGGVVPNLAALHVEQQVDTLVRALLCDADEIRWLSISRHLRSLAEAAPESFLFAVEASLQADRKPIARLLEESGTDNNFLGGRCWHADLLWALELLAWSPQRLSRVCSALAALSEVKTESKWGNSPLNSLVDIFRSWRPQTAAPIEQRLQALDRVMRTFPDVAFSLLDKLVYTGSDTASPSARPRWRDDDAGAGYSVTNDEYSTMFLGAVDRLLKLSTGHPSRLADVIEKIDVLDDERRKTILEAARSMRDNSYSDADREAVRAPLRVKLHWHRNFGEGTEEEIEKYLQPIQKLYDELLPHDLVIRHGWLLKNDWPEPPVAYERQNMQAREAIVNEARANAIREVFDDGKWDAINLLQSAFPGSVQIGASLHCLLIDRGEIANWFVSNAQDLTRQDPTAASISGYMYALPAAERDDFIQKVIVIGKGAGWSEEKNGLFASHCPHCRTLWERVEACGNEAAAAYWLHCFPGYVGDDSDDVTYAAQKLVEAKRPRTAFFTCKFMFNKLDPKLICDLLERFLAGDEPVGRLPDSYHLIEALDRIEETQAIERERLIRLEFGLLRMLGFEKEHHAKTLVAELVRDPEFFMEIVKLVFRGKGETAPEASDERQQMLAEMAYKLLHSCRRQPGARDDGSVDEEQFTQFVNTVRALAQRENRGDVVDILLGEILAHAPVGADGVWPFAAARDVLDQIDTGKMRNGLHTGLFNKRGVHSRGFGDGGGSERALAQHYRSQAAALQISHPLLASVLEGLAASYDRHGVVEDIEARLRAEGE